jgi:hypothetical protein
LATAADDTQLRALLRETPMPGRDITISLEREPSYFAAAEIEGPWHRTIVACDARTDRIVACGSVSSRSRYINGAPSDVGYLSSLRVATTYSGRPDLLRRGYEFLRGLCSREGPPIYLTSIAAENVRARRFLEAGVRGMPTYRPIGEFVTCLMPITRAHRAHRAHPAPVILSAAKDLASPSEDARSFAALRMTGGDEAAFVNRCNASFQFAPHWKDVDLQQHRAFTVVEAGNSIGCVALWDQRHIKQAVVRGYSPRMRLARPLVNFASRLRGGPPLVPTLGTPLSHAYASHLATDPERPDVLIDLLTDLLAAASARGLHFVTAGFAANDPRLRVVLDRFKCRQYRSILYVVHWPEGAAIAESIDTARPAAPEVALL